MHGQRCPLCGEMTAEFNKRLGCWACRCGWTDRRAATSSAPRRPIFKAREEDYEWSDNSDGIPGEDDGRSRRVESPLRVREPGT